jgi:predicted DCC family thiol-disulfide oxidoreductase YuxK
MVRSKILVDGNCIVCDFEVAHYKRKAPEQFDIVDISAPEFNAAQYGLDPNDVNKNLHVLTAKGEVKKGVEAFAQIWSQIPSYSWAAKAIKWPVVYQSALVGYEVFTFVRPLLPKKRS